MYRIPPGKCHNPRPVKSPPPPICREYSRPEGCCRPHCRELHLCSRFLVNQCRDRGCLLSHVLTTPRNLQLLYQRGWSSPDDLARAWNVLQQRAGASALSVCLKYSMGFCTVSDCGRLHVCYRHVLDACPLDDCGLRHNLLGDDHNALLLTRAGLGDTPMSGLLARLREQTRRQAPPQPALCMSVYGRQGCQRHCLRLHYCEAFARGRCRFGAKCYKSHGLGDAHNQRVLKFFGWTEEQVVGEAGRGGDGGKSASPAEGGETADERGGGEKSGLRDQSGKSDQGAGAKTDDTNSTDANEQEGKDLTSSNVSEESPDQPVDKQNKRKSLKQTERNALERIEKEQEEWRQKETEWQKKEKEWELKEKQWLQKGIEWELKEKNWRKNEQEWQVKIQIQEAREKVNNEKQERERQEIEEQTKTQREQDRLQRERDEERHGKEMAEREAQHRELMEKFERLMVDYTASEGIVTAINQNNHELSQQLASLQMLLKEFESRQPQNPGDEWTQQDGTGTQQELDKLRDQLRKHRECVECSICLGVFNQPVTLGCSHSFCRGCLDTATGRMYDCYAQAAAAPSRQCPLCRRLTTALVPCLALENLARSLPEEPDDRRRPTPAARRISPYDIDQ